MKVFTIILILMSIVGLGLAVSGLATGDTVSDGIFKGSEVFETEESYTQFKTALALTDWDLEDVKVLHSDPPILVEFRTHDATHSFPYGQEGTLKNGIMSLFIPGMILLCLGMTSLMYVAYIHEEESQ